MASNFARIHEARDDGFTSERPMRRTIQKTSTQIRQFAAEKGLMLVEVAERMGISKSHRSQIISRESSTATQIEQLAEALGISW